MEKIIFLYILIFIFLENKLEDKRFCTEWKQAFPELSLLLYSSRIEFWFVNICSQIFQLFQHFKESVINPHTVTFLSPNMTVNLVLSAFISSSISLLTNTKDSAFFFILYNPHSNKITSSALSKNWFITFNFKPSWFTWNFLKAYSKAKLKNNGGKAYPCFKHFLIGN